MFITNAISRIYFGVHDSIARTLSNSSLFLYDTLLTFLNILLPNFKRGAVIASGFPGHGGIWPAFVPPLPTDSRSPCPALNALANHGIIPHDGRNISFKELVPICNQVFNFATTFPVFTCKFAATMLQKSYEKDTFDLSDLSVHNGIEHDASLTRYDVSREPDQSKPALDLVDDLLASATGKNEKGHPVLTIADLRRVSEVRRDHSRATNGQFTLDTLHKVFGSSNSSTLLTIFGGDVDSLRTILKEERLPDGWEPSVRKRFGITMASFNSTVLSLELGIREPRGPRKVRLA